MSDLTKSDIEEIIEEGLNNKETLVNIKNKLQSITDYLSDYDNAVVETKYCEILIDHWLVESGEYINGSTNPHQLHETIKVIKSVGSVSECCKLIGNLAYNIIVNDLNNNSQLLIPLERNYVQRFKEVCLDAVSTQASTISTEIAFVEECIELFKTSKDPTKICSDIQINDFLNGNDVCIDFRNFLYNLQTVKDKERKYSKVKELGNDLLKGDNFYLLQGLKETVLSYLKPVIISEKFLDGRVLLEVSGKYIILSHIASEVEQEPRFSRIEEVRFVCVDVIHVDVDLSSAIWHGKNIVVHSNSMIVSKNCVWNVSGNDGKETNRHTDENYIVESRKSIVTLQGNSGESGGNVLIILNHLTGGENLQIVSNGGNGSIGLDGKKGENGVDGQSINDNTFKSLYPPVSLFKNSGKNTNLKETHKNILDSLKSVDCLYRNGVNYACSEATEEFKNATLFEDCSNIDNLYFEVTTNSGSKLLFSFCNENLMFCQSFLLYKGSVGTEGKPGLCGGRGGRGGFGGQIHIFVTNDNSSKILKCSLQGETGPSGKDGSSGKPGKYGLDKAYMDHTFTIFGEDWPKYFLPQESDNITLTIKYTNDNGQAKVFVPHNNKYAEITQTRREMRSSCSAQKESLNAAVNSFFKEESCRKKTISIESIMKIYGENESIANISEISEYVGSAIAVLDNFGEDALDVHRNSEEVSVSRKISFESNSVNSIDWLKCLDGVSHIRLVPKCIYKDPNLLLKQVQRNPNDLITMTNLMFVSMNLDQLNMLWKILDQRNGNQLIESKIKNLNTIFFCDKYKLAVLEHLELNEFGKDIRTLNLEHSIDFIANTNVSVESGLIEKKQKCDRVASFFVEDSPQKREEVIQICENFADDEYVKSSIKIFLQEFGNSISMPSKSKQLLNKNLSFEQRKVGQLKQTLELLKCELQKPKNNNLNQVLIQSIIEDNGVKLAQFRSEIKSLSLECGLLNKLFACYLRIYKRTYTWIGLEDNKGNVDTDIRLAFFNCIRHIGLKSKCYRQLLAFHFDINIVIYTCNESRGIELIDNYNGQSSRKLFLLKEGNLYSEVEVNEELAQIITAEIGTGKIYSNALLLIDSIKEKRGFDDFLDCALRDRSPHHDINKSTIITTRVLNIISQDNDVKLIINAFVLPDERTMLCRRLEKLKHEFSGNEIILHFMALHFKTEVNSVTAKELCFIINILLKNTLEDNKMPLITWIIAAFPHSRWLSELTLFKIETNLKKSLESDRKSLWREYLNKQNIDETLMLLYEKVNDEKDFNLDVEHVEEVLYLISVIPNAFIGLEEVSISEWKYYLKDRYWLYKVDNATNNWSEDQIKLISYYLLSLENKKGTPFCEKFVLLIDAHKQSLTESDKSAIENTLRFLAGDEICIDDGIFGMFSGCPISEWPNLLKTSIYNSDQNRSVEELLKLMKSSGNTTEHVLTSLDNIVDALGDINNILVQLKKEIRNKTQLTNMVEDTLAYILRVKSSQKDTEKSMKNSQYYLNHIGLFEKIRIKYTIVMDGRDNNERENIISEHLNRILVALVAFSIHILLNKELRETQKLAILTFLNSGRNILGQIATGEGKSLIVMSIAIIKAVLCGHSVDVITSSNVLAIRDAEDYKKVYSLFKVGVGNNCSQNIEDRKKAYSNCKVVYGELSSFQRDYLLDRFYSKNMFGDRQFELIIVDEVDSMLLDQGNNILYLSHEIPGVDKLEPLFVFIWKWLNMPNSAEEIEITTLTLKDCIEFDLFGVIKMKNIRDLDLNLTENQLISTWEYLIKEGVIDSNGHLLMQCIDDNNVTVKDRPNCIPEYHFRYLLKNVVERKKQLEVPNHLKDFVKAHLDDWINSAVNALKLEMNVHYVVDVVRSPTNSSRTANIIALDNNTGTDMVNSHWDAGLHQFLQLKHGCRLSLISLKAVFKSNLSYFKHYALLYGLTGTLGSIHDRDMLKEMYNVEFVTIPTAKPTKLLQAVPQVHQCTESWMSAIIENSFDVSETRSVLVVCETIKDVNMLEENFKTFLLSKQNQRTIYSYKRDYELVEASKASPLIAQPGKIILSTNLAGRGTDIKLSSDLKIAGGLHVCLTFLPRNGRIEEQAYGRVARNGDPGSSQLIIKSPVNAVSASKIIDLKKERDLKEHLRITNIKEEYEFSVKVEEEYFKKFSNCYENLQKEIKSPNQEMKKIVLQDCLDQWAFWLDCRSRNSLSDPIDSFLDKLSKYINIDVNSWFEHLTNPSRLLQLGLICIKMKEYKIAISFFNQVIQSEPSFAENALYYRPLAKAKYTDIVKDDVTGDFEKARELFKKRVDTLLLSAQIVDWLKVHNTKSSLQIDSFKEQQENVINTYMLLINSIDQVLGSGVDFDHEISDVANDLIKRRVIMNLKIKKGISENDLKFLEEYGIIPNKMIEFFNKCDGQLDVKKFKTLFPLPSKELFWKELLEKNILIHEEKYVCVNLNELELNDSLLAKIIKKLKLEVEPANKADVWIYDFDYINGMECFSFCKKRSLLDKIGIDNYRQFKAKGVFYSNKRATLVSSVQSVNFKLFNSLSQDDFQKIGICNATAAVILSELEENGVIVKTGKMQFCLLLNNVDQISRLELVKCKAYTEDVRSLLRFQFSFGLAMKGLLNLLSTNQNLKINLNTKPHVTIVHLLIERNMIKSAVSSTSNHTSVLEGLYRDEMIEDDWKNLFTNIYDGEKAGQIISELMNCNWLLKTNRISLSILVEEKYKLNLNKKGEINKATQISVELQNDSDTIEFILLRHAAKTNRVNEYAHLLDAATGFINKVETPGFDLKPLRHCFINNKLSISELGLFTLNGINQILQLGEKTWTWKMKRDTFIATLFGLAQVAVGSAFLCMNIVKSGIDDLIFCVNCMFTGTFHWKDYFINKALALVYMLKAPLLKIFSNSFGNSVSFSVDSLKTAGRKFTEACKQVSGKMISSCKGDFFVSVLSRVTKAVGSSAISNTLHSVILPKIENLGKLIISLFDKSIEEILKSHGAIRSAQQLCNILGENKGKDKIDEVCLKFVKKYRSSRNNVWFKAFSHIKRIINTAQDLINQKFELDLQDIVKKANAVYTFFDFITTLFKTEEYKMIINPIDHFLITLDNHLQEEIEIAKKSRSIGGIHTLENCNAVDFSSDLMFQLKDFIKNEINSLLNESIILPLFEIINDKLTVIFIKITNKSFNNLFSGKEKLLIDEAKSTYFTNKNSDIVKKSKKNKKFVDSEYDNCLIQILKVRKNNVVFAEILKQNTEINVTCLTFLCSVIPIVLKKHGINVPNLEITVDRSGVKEFYKTSKDKPASLSVTIRTNDGILYNIQSNKVLVKGLLKSIVVSLMHSDPQVQTIADNFLEEITRFLENQFPNNDYEENVKTEYKKSLTSEYDSYQHSHPDGSWTISSNVDCYIVEEESDPEVTMMEPLSDYVENHIHKGFMVALSKLNNHIHKVQTHLKVPFNLTLDDFDGSKFDIFPPTSSDLNMFHGRAIEYKLIMPFKVVGGELVNFVFTLKLVNQVHEIQPFTPYGPHIVFQVEPINDAKYMALGVKGHVLLDKKCATGKITSKDCQIAGDLILPTGFKFITNTDTRKTIDVLILGDLELKYAQQDINKTSWKVTMFQNLHNEQYKTSVISDLVQSFKSPKCIIFHLGTSLVQTHLADKEIAERVIEIVEMVMSYFRGAKVVMFALHLRKFAEEMHNPTILKVNGHLKRYCASIEVIYVETSRILGPDDLEMNGKDVNKKGCKKLTKFFDKISHKFVT